MQIDPNVAEVFGTVLAPTITASNLPSLAVASSGNVDFSSDSHHFASIGSDVKSNVTIKSVRDGLLLRARGDADVLLGESVLYSGDSASHDAAYHSTSVGGLDAVRMDSDSVWVRNLQADNVTAPYPGVSESLLPRLRFSAPDRNVTIGSDFRQGLSTSEPVWLLENSAVRMNFTNVDSGSKVSMHWRPNHKDELELIKLVDGASPTLLAKFGLDEATVDSLGVFGSGSARVVGVTSRQGAASPDAVVTASYYANHPSLKYRVHAAVTAPGTSLTASDISGSPHASSSALVSGGLSGALNISSIHPSGLPIQSMTPYAIHLTVADENGGHGPVVDATFSTTDTEDPSVVVFSPVVARNLASASADIDFNVHVTDAVSLASVRLLQSHTQFLTEQDVASHADTETVAASGTVFGPVVRRLSTIKQPLSAPVYNYLLAEDTAGNRAMQTQAMEPPSSVALHGTAAALPSGITPSGISVPSGGPFKAMAVAVLSPSSGATDVLSASAATFAASVASGIIAQT